MGILSFFQTILQTISDTVKGTFNLLQLLPQIKSFFDNITSFLPSFITPFIIIEVFITFWLIILKRKSQ